MAVFGGPDIVEDGLVLYLDAANPKSYPGSGTTWKDLSGNGANMAINNGAVFSDDVGGGILLDGVNDYINGTKPTGYNGNGNFTYDVWFKFNSGDNISGGAFIMGNNSRSDGQILSGNGFNSGLTVDGSGNLKVFTFNGGGGHTDYDTGFNVTVGEICQVGMIHNASTNKAGFKNGQVSSVQSRWSTQNFTYLLFGGQHNEASYFTQLDYSNITFYSIKVYNRALSAEEILQNYNATKSRFGL